MPFAFNLTFDPKTSLEIERLHAGLAALDIPKHDFITQYGPCVTILVVGDRVRPAFVMDVLKLRLPKLGPVSAALTEPCIVDGARLAARMAARWHRLDGELNALEVLQYPPVQAIWQAPLKDAAAGTRDA